MPPTQVVRMVMRHHEEQRQKEERAKREEQAKLRRVAAAIAKEVKQFWSNVEKVRTPPPPANPWVPPPHTHGCHPPLPECPPRVITWFWGLTRVLGWFFYWTGTYGVATTPRAPMGAGQHVPDTPPTTSRATDPHQVTTTPWAPLGTRQCVFSYLWATNVSERLPVLLGDLQLPGHPRVFSTLSFLSPASPGLQILPNGHQLQGTHRCQTAHS